MLFPLFFFSPLTGEKVKTINSYICVIAFPSPLVLTYYALFMLYSWSNAFLVVSQCSSFGENVHKYIQCFRLWPAHLVAVLGSLVWHVDRGTSSSSSSCMVLSLNPKDLASGIFLWSSAEWVGKMLHGLGTCPPLHHLLVALFYTEIKNYKDNPRCLRESWKVSRVLSESWLSFWSFWLSGLTWPGYSHTGPAVACLSSRPSSRPPSSALDGPGICPGCWAWPTMTSWGLALAVCWNSG